MKRCLSLGESKDSLRVSVSVQSQPLLALHWGHTHAIMCNYGGLRQQMHKKIKSANQ